MSYLSRALGCGAVVALMLCCGGVVAVGVPSLVRPVGGSGGAWAEMFDRAPSADATAVEFRIAPGEDAGTVATRLVAAGLVADERVFRLIATQTGLGQRIAAGTFELRRTMTSRQVLDVITSSAVKTRLVTMPEGKRLEEVAEKLSQDGFGTPTEILAAIVELAKSAGGIAAQRPPGTSLEGYLAPETFRVATDATLQSVLRDMVALRDRQLTAQLREGFAARRLSVHEAITLASIVEREAVVAEERPIIASVYLNRLRIGMILQADPTVQYALAQDPRQVARWGLWKKDLTFEDLRLDSPYNTYRYGGLPPAPICAPGLASIAAVAAPAETDFLFFVARPDGSHAFAKTFAEHNANVARYQSGR